MPAPLFKVEVAFADGPNAAAPSWTDISSYVRRRPPLTYSRGNTDETTRLQSGFMRFVVDNTDGRFTPGSSASTSAWGTALKIRRPVRLSIWNGAAYVVEWSGTVDDWGASWRGGKKGESLVSCSDRVAQAGRVPMPPLLDGEILSDSPIAFWPMTDPAGSTAALNQTGTSGPQPLTAYSAGTPGAVILFGEDSVGVDEQTRVRFNRGDDGTGSSAVLAGGTGTAVSGNASIEAVVEVLSVAAGASVGLVGFGFGTSLQIALTSSGIPYATCQGLTATAVTGFPGGSVHLAATYSTTAGTGTLRLYINGVQAATATGAAGTTSRLAVYVGGGGDADDLFDGYVSHVAAYSSELSAARVLAHAQALNGAPGEFTGARWNRLCRIAGMDSTTYTADTGQVEMGPQGTAGQTLASLLQTVADTEQGYAYAAADGVLTLKSSATRYGATSATTFTPQQLDPGLQWITNDAYLANDATVTRSGEGGGTRRTISSTSKTDYGTYGATPSLPFLTDDQCESLSSWLVYKYADPGTRADGVAVDVTTKALTASTILGIDVNSLITLSPMPAPAPASSVPLFVDGLEGTLGDTWQVAYKTSPGTLYDGWLLDTDLLGTGTLLLY